MGDGIRAEIAWRGTVIEATLTRWTIVALGASAIVIALIAPWYTAQGLDGSADLTGWGAWRTTGVVDASLRPLPLGLLVALLAGVMSYGAARSAFGVAVVGAMTTLAATILPFLLTPVLDRRVPGRESVAIDMAAAPIAILAIAFVATVVCWIGYARCVLRPSPRSDLAGT